MKASSLQIGLYNEYFLFMINYWLIKIGEKGKSIIYRCWSSRPGLYTVFRNVISPSEGLLCFFETRHLKTIRQAVLFIKAKLISSLSSLIKYCNSKVIYHVSQSLFSRDSQVMQNLDDKCFWQTDKQKELQLGLELKIRTFSIFNWRITFLVTKGNCVM